MPTHQAITVDSLTRGKIAGINDNRVLVQGTNDEGTTLAYWSTIDDAPMVGDVLSITITQEP